MSHPIGRRILRAYLTIFLHSSPASKPVHDYDFIADRTLNTYGLGQYVAPQWKLGRVLRWQPILNPRTKLNYDFKKGNRDGTDVDPELAAALRAHPHVVRSVGLYKVMGEAVQAIVGGTYHQFVSLVLYESVCAQSDGFSFFPTGTIGRVRYTSDVPHADFTTSPQPWPSGFARGVPC